MTPSPSSERRSSLPGAVSRLGPLDVLVFAAWCGLAGGELEVAARVGYRPQLDQPALPDDPAFRLAGPAVDLLCSSGSGPCWPWRPGDGPGGRGGWGPRLLLDLGGPAGAGAGRSADLRGGLAALRAWGSRRALAPVLERHPVAIATTGWRWASPRCWGWSCSRRAGSSAAIGSSGGARGRPLPPAGPPNVLLIVLDTVRADHLSLYGYERPTTPAPGAAGPRGASASTRPGPRPPGRSPRTPACSPADGRTSWTSMEWPRCRRRSRPWPNTWGSLGYATAGFVGNTFYCSYDTGWIAASLTTRTMSSIGSVADRTLADAPRSVPDAHRPPRTWFARSSWGLRRPAVLAERARETRPSSIASSSTGCRGAASRRPFFAFLNYVDAHAPYSFRRGSVPLRPVDDDRVRRCGSCSKAGDSNRRRLPAGDRGSAAPDDAYDNCLAYLDDQLGELIDELGLRGVLDRTIVIVTADHGEGLGSTASSTTARACIAPRSASRLLIVPPLAASAGPGRSAFRSASATLPATVAEFVMPGRSRRSRAAAWPGCSAVARPHLRRDVVLSELTAPNHPIPTRVDPRPAGPLVALAEGDFVYIRNEGDGSEELFNERDDPGELTISPATHDDGPVLRRFRDRLRREQASAVGDAGTAPVGMRGRGVQFAPRVSVGIK